MMIEKSLCGFSLVEKNDVKKLFGASVKSWRQQLGFSQEELAERSDLHRTYISDVERGTRNLSLESMDRLAKALDISVAALFPAEPDKADAVPKGDAPRVHDLVDILMVEDNHDDLEMALHAFKRARFANRVQFVSDGAEALDFLFLRGKYAKRSPADLPQVILLDLKLPKLSGLEVLREIRADKRTAKLHVVILTTSNSPSDMAACRALGAQHYIVKPVDFRQLCEVTSHLNLNWALLKPPLPG